MSRIITQAGPVYQAAAFKEIGWIEHGFGTRGVALDGYLSHFGLKDAVVAKTNQKHGNRVHLLEGGAPCGTVEADAFITQSPGAVCFVRTADCVPVLLCDPEHKCVGAVHAGWRGHVCDVIGNAVRIMEDVAGSDPSKLVAAIGPSICRRCYEVGEDVVDAFEKKRLADGQIILRASVGESRSNISSRLRPNNQTSRFLLDLQAASKGLLIASGVPRENISVLPLCTSCGGGDFASYRRERAEKSRQVNFIYIKD